MTDPRLSAFDTAEEAARLRPGQECGHETRNGPCNMKKNHPAPFHRNRVYKRALQWRIKDGGNNKVIEFGAGRVQLGYALTRILVNHDDLVIEITK